MFYNQFKDAIDHVSPLKRPFVRNMVLVWMFCFLAIAAVNLKNKNSMNEILIILSFIVFVANIVFSLLITKIKYAYLFYLFFSIGGLGALGSLFAGALEMLGLGTTSLVVFWFLSVCSFILLLYIYYTNFDREMLKDFCVSRKPIYTWNIEKDIHSTANNKYSPFMNILRIFVAPLAPAIGMALSQSFQGKQEWLILGSMILLLALILAAGYLKFLALSLKLLYWSRILGSMIVISDTA